MSAILKGEIREKLGSRACKKLRLQGRIPASIQGEGKEHLNLSLDSDEFLAARRAHEHLFDIELPDGGEGETALVRELHWDYLQERILHVEFRRVVRGQKTSAEVELHFLGQPKGGLLNHLVTHITIQAIPSKIPDNIEVRVENLEIGQHILASDLELPEDVSLDIDPGTTIALVAAPKEEVETSDEDEEDEGLMAPETPED